MLVSYKLTLKRYRYDMLASRVINRFLKTFNKAYKDLLILTTLAKFLS